MKKKSPESKKIRALINQGVPYKQAVAIVFKKEKK